MRRAPLSIVVVMSLAVGGVGVASGENLLRNAEFDSGLSGWQVDYPQVHFAGPDAGFSPGSGSMQIDHVGPVGAVYRARQCVAVEPGASYEAAANAALLAPDHPRSRLFLALEWHADGACAGAPLVTERLVETDERYWFWLLLTGERVAPAGAVAVAFTLGLEKVGAGDWPVYALFDRAYLGAAASPLDHAVLANRITNGDFATNLAGWQFDDDVVFSGDDADGNPASGSLEIRNDDDSPIGDEDARQCFPIQPGSYDFSARFKLVGTTPPGTANVELRLYSAAGCPDGAQIDNRVLATGTLRNAWGSVQATGVNLPANVASARLKLETIKTGPGTLVGRYDNVVFGDAAGGGACVPSATTLCLRGGRFRLTASWVTGLGTAGPGFAVPLTSDTGYFWFFDPANVETVIKVLDACGLNQHFWVYAGGMTDLGITLTVEDTQTPATATYQNPLGTPFQTITDVNALAACP